MKLVVLGSSGTYPVPGNPASGYLVVDGATTIWMDAGPGTFLALAAVTEPAELDAVILSHLHADHCSDIFALMHYLSYGPKRRERPVDVYAPTGSENRLAAFVDAEPENGFSAAFRFHEARHGTTATVGSLHLEFADAAHSVPAVYSAVSCDSRRLVYTGDTGPCDGLAVFASGADVLLCEASLTPTDPPWFGHMTPSQAGQAAAEAGVDRLILTHMRSTVDPKLAIAEAAAEFGRDPAVAFAGMQIEI